MAEQLFPASIGGVPFKVTGVNEQGGPYNVLHERAGREPVSRYNGPRPTKFSVDAYLIGPRHQIEWQRLKELLSRGGSHRLIHPWHGSVMVALDGPYDAEQSSGHHGMTKVKLPFHVAGPETVPSLRIETDELLIEDADAVDLAMADAFEADFSVAGSNTARAASTNIVQDIVAAVASMNAVSSAQFASVNSTSAGINTFGASVETLIATPRTLATTVANLIDATYGAITGVAESTGEIDPVADANLVLSALLRGRQVLVALRILREGNSFGSSYDTPRENTPLQRRRALNQRRLVQLVRISAVSGAARSAARLSFENSEQVRAAFDQITSAIDNAQASVDDATYQALVSMRASLSAHLRSNVGRLPEVTTYTPQATVPSLLLAQTLYGDARRADEVAERNSVIHPGFIPGGVPIEVLSA